VRIRVNFSRTISRITTPSSVNKTLQNRASRTPQKKPRPTGRGFFFVDREKKQNITKNATNKGSFDEFWDNCLHFAVCRAKLYS
jgi:hypothetical protein